MRLLRDAGDRVAMGRNQERAPDGGQRCRGSNTTQLRKRYYRTLRTHVSAECAHKRVFGVSYARLSLCHCAVFGVSRARRSRCVAAQGPRGSPAKRPGSRGSPMVFGVSRARRSRCVAAQGPRGSPAKRPGSRGSPMRRPGSPFKRPGRAARNERRHAGEATLTSCANTAANQKAAKLAAMTTGCCAAMTTGCCCWHCCCPGRRPAAARPKD